MCGIFALLSYHRCLTKETLLKILVDGLIKLEYRGYDSCGLAYFDKDDICIIKKIGGASCLKDKITKILDDKTLSASTQLTNIGIAHTRWATHGTIEKRNTHPHTSGDNNEFVVVHNGIVDNWKELKNFLIDKGYSFVSDTDTEVVAKLALYYYNDMEHASFRDIISKVVQQIRGSFAFVFISSIFPNEVCFTKEGSSPLILAEIDHNDSNGFEFVVSSDLHSINEHTNRIMNIEEGDIGHIDCNGNLDFINYKLNCNISRKFFTIENLRLNNASQNTTSYMQKEIYEQAITTTETLRDRIDYGNKNVVIFELIPYMNRILNSNRLLFLGCGTSYHSCVAMRELIEEFSCIPCSTEIATEFFERNPLIFPGDTCFFISQSGETADTLSALKYCKDKGALCIGITNSNTSSIAGACHCNININAGEEIGVASTKAYTSQILVLILISLQISQNRELTQDKLKRRDKIISELRKLPDYISEVLSKDSKITKIANELVSQNCDKMIIIGRGYHYATCKEGALKIKEISYIHCEGIYAGELKHGSLALIDEHMPVFIIGTQDKLYSKISNAYELIKARNGCPYVMCTKDDNSFEKVRKLIRVPETIDCLQAIVNIIPFQLLSLHLAEIKGYNVDKPRNLAKSVTVSD